MTDRELLRAAARVCGLELTWGEKYKLGEDEIDCTDLPYVVGGSPDVGPAYWNPLEDDGDALRLAAKLNLVVDFFEGEVISANKVVKFDVNDIASARLAIVRAAASMSPDLAAGGREGVR
jgi:hypothetical protein